MKKKAILSLLLAAVLFAGSVFTGSAAIRGDVDGDGKVTAADARAALRFSVRLETPTAAQKQAADMDADGIITASDARTILRMAVNLGSTFDSLLYQTAHQYYYKKFNEIHPNFTLMERALDAVSDWCCYYSLHDVYIPVRRQLGYSEETISHVAPSSYSKDKLSKALSNTVKMPISKALVFSGMSVYVPSLVLDYYREHPQYAKTYIFWEYYDDVITKQLVEPTFNPTSYRPQVGDFVFMSNKERTYVEVNGEMVPTVDHIAQIIKVNADGTFLCTEGSIIQSGEDGKARVRERWYSYDPGKQTYVFQRNPIVNVLAICRPILSE